MSSNFCVLVYCTRSPIPLASYTSPLDFMHTYIEPTITTLATSISTQCLCADVDLLQENNLKGKVAKKKCFYVLKNSVSVVNMNLVIIIVKWIVCGL